MFIVIVVVVVVVAVVLLLLLVLLFNCCCCPNKLRRALTPLGENGVSAGTSNEEGFKCFPDLCGVITCTPLAMVDFIVLPAVELVDDNTSEEEEEEEKVWLGRATLASMVRSLEGV